MKELEGSKEGSLPPSHTEIPFDDDERATDPREYWLVVYRYRRVVVSFVLLSVLFAVMSIPWRQHVYTANGILYLQGQSRGIFDGPEPVAGGTGYYHTQRQLLRSRSLIAHVIRDLDLETNSHFTVTPESMLSWLRKQIRSGMRTGQSWIGAWINEYVGFVSDAEAEKSPRFEFGVHPALIDRYMGGLNVQQLPDSQLIRLSFTSSDPGLSQRVVNAHARTFVDRNLETRFELTAETRQFLENKLAELKINVERSEQALNRFQQDHEIVSVDRGSSLVLDQLKRLNSDLTEARSRRIELETLHALVIKRDNRLLSKIIDNPTMQQLRSQIAELEVQLASLSTRFKPTYRGIVALKQEIDEARSRMDQEINRIVLTIERDFHAATAKERALAAEAENARRTALDLQERAVEYGLLEREVASNRALYEAVFKKTKEAALTGDEPMPNLRIVDRAELPVYPDSTNASRTLLLSFVVGSFGGVGLAFLLHVLDNTVRTPEDVGRFIRLPTLGIVPDLHKLASNGQAQALGYVPRLAPPLPAEREGERTKQLMVGHHPLSLMAEMYRAICTGILFSRANKPPQTILVTSSQPHEGKTVTAINLSIMLAQRGEPVLLIDADLRGGHCHKLLGVNNGNGLTNVLTSNANTDALVKKTKVANLSLLCRGVCPPNPADLLASDRMRQLLDELSAEFRFIVVDSAPLLPVSDTVLLSTKMDGVILVVRGQQVSRNIVRKARDRLDYVNANVIGVVLNGVDISSGEYSEYRYVHEAYYSRYPEHQSVKTSTVGEWHVFDEEIHVCGEASNTVSADVIESIIRKYTEYVGPMGPVIVRDHVAALDESEDAFPGRRLAELIDAMSSEISNEALRAAFRVNISETLRKANSGVPEGSNRDQDQSGLRHT